jgi:hypothetical protein
MKNRVDSGGAVALAASIVQPLPHLNSYNLRQPGLNDENNFVIGSDE